MINKITSNQGISIHATKSYLIDHEMKYGNITVRHRCKAPFVGLVTQILGDTEIGNADASVL